MFIEDARPMVREAIALLHDGREKLQRPKLRIQSMAEFLSDAAQQPLSAENRRLILDQAILVLDQFYAHLPFKRVRYAVDPVQRLRLIRSRLDSLGDLDFHTEVVRTFSKLRDPHTFYALPAPFAGAFAFLPFRVQHYFEEGMRRFVVTHVMEGFDHLTFRRGAEITHYNGMPMEEAVWHETGFDSAGNEDAQFIRGLNSLFGRPLDNTPPREEHWAVLQYTSAGGGDEELGILLPWNVMTGFRREDTATGGRSSIFTTMADTDASRKLLWGRSRLKKEKEITDYYSRPPADDGVLFMPKARPQNESRLPAFFSFTATSLVEDDETLCAVRSTSLFDPEHPEESFGYLRIASFNTPDKKPFLEECRRILELLNQMAPDGLIVDVRSNPGGNIAAAECVLQMLTPNEIRPSQFHFINSRLTREIARQLTIKRVLLLQQEFRDWADDILASLAEGSVLSAGRPLTPSRDANNIGQVYQGPVTLLIDALSYSATDIFAAGFADNEIGRIIGVDRNTGGGGANRWLHSELLTNTAGSDDLGIESLPLRSEIGLAIRRMTRVGANSGTSVEDVGVSCAEEDWHPRTRLDILQGDPDLLSKACAHLGRLPAYRLRILAVRMEDSAVRVALGTSGIHRVECYLNNLPQSSHVVPDADGEAEFDVLIPATALPGKPARVDIRGYALVEEQFNIPSGATSKTSAQALERGRAVRAQLARIGVSLPRTMKLAAATTAKLS